MIQQAIETDDPVIFYEPKRRYWEKAEVRRDRRRRPRRCTRPRVLREGERRRRSSAYGPMVKTCLEAADGRRRGGPARSRSSTCARCRRSTSTRSRRRSRRPAGSSSCTRRRRSSAWAPRSRPRITERCFYHLEAPVLRVGGYNLPYPPSKLEEEFLPDLDRVLDAVDRSLAY